MLVLSGSVFFASGVLRRCPGRAGCGLYADIGPFDSGRRSSDLDSMACSPSSGHVLLGLSRRWFSDEADSGEKQPQGKPMCCVSLCKSKALACLVSQSYSNCIVAYRLTSFFFMHPIEINSCRLPCQLCEALFGLKSSTVQLRYSETVPCLCSSDVRQGCWCIAVISFYAELCWARVFPYKLMTGRTHCAPFGRASSSAHLPHGLRMRWPVRCANRRIHHHRRCRISIILRRRGVSRSSLLQFVFCNGSTPSVPHVCVVLL